MKEKTKAQIIVVVLVLVCIALLILLNGCGNLIKVETKTEVYVDVGNVIVVFDPVTREWVEKNTEELPLDKTSQFPLVNHDAIRRYEENESDSKTRKTNRTDGGCKSL